MMPSILPSIPITPPKGGVRPDLSALEIGLAGLVDGENWLFSRGEFRSRPGLAKMGTTLGSRPVGVTYYDLPSLKGNIVVMTTRGWWAWDATSETWVDLTATGAILTISVNAGGTGYAPGDTGTIGAGAATYSVTTAPAGVVTAVSLTAGGTGYSVATGVSTTATSGGGSGLKLNILTQSGQLTGSATTIGVFRLFEKSGVQYLVGVNGKDHPKVWDQDLTTPSDFRDLADSPPHASCMAVCANRMLLANFTASAGSSQAIIYSDFNNFDNGWSTCVETLLADTPGEIMALREMGNLSFAIYKRDSIYMGMAQGGADPFAYQMAASHCVGPASPDAVISDAVGRHIFLGYDGGVYVFDGTRPVSMGDHIRDHIRSYADFDRFGRSFGTYDWERNMAWFWYPRVLGADTNAAVAIDVSSGACWPMRWPGLYFGAAAKPIIVTAIRIGELTMPIGSITLTLGEMTRRRPNLLVGEIGGQVYVDTGLDDDGTAIPVALETGLTDGGSPSTFKTVTASDHQFLKTTSSQALSVDLGSSEYGEAPTYDGAQSLGALSSGGPWEAGHRSTGRLFSVKLTGNVTDEVSWRGSSLAVASRGVR